MGGAARAAAGAADALHNSTPKSRHRRAAGRDPPAHQTPFRSNTTLLLLGNCFFAFLSNVAISSLPSNFVLARFSSQPVRHKVTPPAFHPDAPAVLGHRDTGEIYGMAYQFAIMIHSLDNEMLLFVQKAGVCKSGRGEECTGAGCGLLEGE